MNTNTYCIQNYSSECGLSRWSLLISLLILANSGRSHGVQLTIQSLLSHFDAASNDWSSAYILHIYIWIFCWTQIMAPKLNWPRIVQSKMCVCSRCSKYSKCKMREKHGNFPLFCNQLPGPDGQSCVCTLVLVWSDPGNRHAVAMSILEQKKNLPRQGATTSWEGTLSPL